MNKQDATSDLDQLILAMEQEHRAEGLLLKQEFRSLVENFQPVSIVTSVLNDLKIQPGISTAVKDAAVGLAARFVAKKVQMLPGDNPIVQTLKKLLETFIIGTNPPNTQKVSA